MFNKMNYENFNDYLLSLNIAQIAREYGFKKIGMTSLYHLTQVLKSYIKELAKNCKEYAELLNNRFEVNLIDVLNVILDFNNSNTAINDGINNRILNYNSFSNTNNKLTMEYLLSYMKDNSKINKNLLSRNYYTYNNKLRYQFSKKNYINKIISNEKLERENFIKKINANTIINVFNYNILKNNNDCSKIDNNFSTSTVNLCSLKKTKNNILFSESYLNMIPNSIKYFPKEISLSKTHIKLNLALDLNTKNSQNDLKKNIERKTLEDVVNTNNYFDNLSKKHKRKNSVDVNTLCEDIYKVENFSFGTFINKNLKEKNSNAADKLSTYINNVDDNNNLNNYKYNVNKNDVDSYNDINIEGTYTYNNTNIHEEDNYSDSNNHNFIDDNVINLYSNLNNIVNDKCINDVNKT